MIKNIEKNRLSGVIDGPCDISYQSFVREFIHDIELSNPFAVTLTMNSCSWRTHSQNFRHFMNRLNQSYLQNGYRRYGNRLTVIPTREGTRYVRPHYHCVIDNPFPERNDEFRRLVKESWRKTSLGQPRVEVDPMRSDRWIEYMTKLYSKTNFRESIDWENLILSSSTRMKSNCPGG